MNDNLYGSICLSEIPKELIRTANNGKKYLSIEVKLRRSPDTSGNTHYVKVACRKDALPEGVSPYIGSLKPSKFSNENSNTVGQPTTQPVAAPQPAPAYNSPQSFGDSDPLPF